MRHNKNKSSKKSKSSNDSKDKCKYCQTKLDVHDIKKQSKKKLTERYSLYWTGIERPYIQLYKVICPNPRCRKSYVIREKKSSWLYK